MKRSATLVLGLLFSSQISQAYANGALAEFPAGGIIFKNTQHITLAREDLQISSQSVHVHYVFSSDQKAGVARAIRFPMPAMPQGDSPDSLAQMAADEGKSQLQNYMDFKVSVDGKILTPKHQEYAWFNGKNVTAELKKMGVPVFAATEDMPEKLGKLPGSVVDKLKIDHLVQGSGDWLVPQWNYQSVFEWRQVFKPGSTDVDISYTPIVDHPADISLTGLPDSYIKSYCVGDRFQKAVAASSGILEEAGKLGYISTTAKYQHGPIGEFHLTVKEGPESVASLCAPEGLSKVDGKLEWAAKNFVPKGDLEVLFAVP